MVARLDDYRDRPKLVQDKVPPQDVDLEMEVLGGLLLDRYAIERVGGLLTPATFYMTDHQEIYKAIQWLYLNQTPIDISTVSRRLQTAGKLEAIGGRSKIAGLVETVVSAVNIDVHALILRELAKRRKLIEICQHAIAQAYQMSSDWEDLLSETEERIFQLTESSTQAGLKPISDVLAEQMTKVEALSMGDRPPGTPTHFYDLDAMTGGGLKEQQLIIVAGRPGMGKSAFAVSAARNIASAGEPVAVFSLEMSNAQNATRLWSSETGIESGRINAGRIELDEWGKLGDGLVNLSGMPIYLDESTDVTPAHVASQCRRIKAQHDGKLGLIVVDYLHLMLDGDEDDVKRLGSLTRGFKKLARSLGCPIMLLSQLSRGVEGRADKRPVMSDLRQSGAIEQDADIILMLYRDEYYNPDTQDKGIVEVLIRKQREGPTGTVKLLFQPEFSRFRNPASPGAYERTTQRAYQQPPEPAVVSRPEPPTVEYDPNDPAIAAALNDALGLSQPEDPNNDKW